MQRFRLARVTMVLALAIAVRPGLTETASSAAQTSGTGPAASTLDPFSEPGRAVSSSAAAPAPRPLRVATDPGHAGPAAPAPAATAPTDPSTATDQPPAATAAPTTGDGGPGPATPPTTTVAPTTTAPPPAAPAIAPAPTVSPTASEEQVLALLNLERSGAGLPALTFSSGATSVARPWSAHMAATTALGHNLDLSGDLDAAGVVRWTTISENVGYGPSIDQIHALFMGSPVHRGNILNPRVQEVGVGVATGGGYLWVTLDFVGW